MPTLGVKVDNINTKNADMALTFNILMRGVEDEIARRIVEVWQAHIDDLPSLLKMYPYEKKTKNPGSMSLRQIEIKFSQFLSDHMVAFGIVLSLIESHLMEQAKNSYEYGARMALKISATKPVVESEAMPALVFSAKGVRGLEPMSIAWLRAIVNAPSPWDKKILMARFETMSKRERRKLLTIIASAISEGEAIKTVISKLRNVTKQTASKCETIARSEIMRVSNTAMLLSYGNNKAVDGIQAIATLDKITCIICASYDRSEYWYGKRRPHVSEAPTYPVHPRCRCFYVPISALWRRLGVEPPFKTRASAKGPVEYSLDYSSWLRRMEKSNPGFAVSILGGDRYKMWVKGLSLKSMVKPTMIGRQVAGRIRTLKELQRQLERLT